MSTSIRRLARVYRAAAVWQQLAALALPLLVFLVAETPWMWAGAAIVFGLLCSLRLDLGLVLIVCAIPSAFVYKSIGANIVSPLEMITLVCFGAWVIRYLTPLPPSPARRGGEAAPPTLAGKGGGGLGLTSLDWAVLAFVAVAFLSLLIAEDQNSARWELRILIVEPALVYLMIRTTLGRFEGRDGCAAQTAPRSDGREGLLRLADGLMVGAVVVAAIGLYQFFFTDYVEAVQGVRRILGVYDSPNHVSLFLGRIVPISLCLAAFGADRRRRVAHGLALIPILLCLYLTYSRGAWLLGLPAALLFIGIIRGRRGALLALGLLGLALLALLPIIGTERIASLLTLEAGTNFRRLVLWQGAWRVIAAHPFWGVGLGNFVRWYPRYRLDEGGHEPVQYHPHNLLLDTWTALGVPGLLVLTWLLIAFFRRGLAAYRRLAADPALRALCLGLMASMVSFLAHGLVDTGFRLTDLAFVFMVTVGIMQALPDAHAAAADARG